MRSQVRISPVAVSLIDIARMYKAIDAEIKALETKLQPYRDTLEKSASESGGTLDLGSFKITFTPASREVFSLKEARLVIDSSVLKPFVRVCSYTQLRVVEKKAA